MHFHHLLAELNAHRNDNSVEVNVGAHCANFNRAHAGKIELELRAVMLGVAKVRVIHAGIFAKRFIPQKTNLL